MVLEKYHVKIITGLINHYEGSLFISGSVSYAIDVFLET